jgi:hypothetical protein
MQVNEIRRLIKGSAIGTMGLRETDGHREKGNHPTTEINTKLRYAPKRGKLARASRRGIRKCNTAMGKYNVWQKLFGPQKALLADDVSVGSRCSFSFQKRHKHGFLSADSESSRAQRSFLALARFHSNASFLPRV